MYCIGIESSSETSGISIVNEKEEILLDFNLYKKQNHSKYLFSILKKALAEIDISIKNISCISVNKGPGSFTGLRVGLTLAKTLSYINKIPIIGISSFKSLIKSVEFLNHTVVILIYNKKQECYGMVIDKNKKILTKPGIYDLNIFIKKIKNKKKIALVGDGYIYYNKYIQDNKLLLIDIPYNLILPKASNIGILGIKSFLKGQIDNIFSLNPEYIKPFKEGSDFNKKNNL